MADDLDYLILDTNEQKIERRMMDRRADIAKYRSKSEKHSEYLRREVQEELRDFNKYRREAIQELEPTANGSGSDQIYMKSKLRTLNSLKDFEDEIDCDVRPQLMMSIWDRLAQREQIGKKDWKHLRPDDLNKPLEEAIGRVASFSRAFKDFDKFQMKHKDMVKGNVLLEDQQKSNKEKMQLIRIQAKKCYDSLIKANNKELEKHGLIVCLNLMLEMNFDIAKLHFPSHYMSHTTFAIILKIVWLSSTLQKVKRDVSMNRLLDNSYQDFFKSCEEILNKQEILTGYTANNWSNKDEGLFEQMVNSQRMSLVSWRDNPPDKGKLKLTKHEQNERVHIGEIAIEMLKRNFVKKIAPHSKTLAQTRSSLAVYFGEIDAGLMLEKLKSGNND